MPRLVIRKGEGLGQDHVLGGECVVGRDRSATFVLGDVLVSRRHFRVFPEGGSWWLEDLGSTNGTLVNGQRTTRRALTDGDRIAAGNTELLFVQKDMLAAAAPGASKAAPPPPPAAKPGAPGAPATAPGKKVEAPVPRRRRG